MNRREERRFKQLYTQFERLLNLQGYRDATISSYTRGIRRLAERYDQCPDKRLTKAEFEHHFSELLKTHSWSTIKCDRNGIMRYWELVLERDWPWIELVRPPVIKQLPDILSHHEITLILAAVHKRHFRVFLYIVYILGLRLAEALFLKVGDIDHEHQRVHIRDGKGHKDRFVTLPECGYSVLCRFWLTHRHPKWIFPSLQPSRYDSPMDRGSAQKAMKLATKAANIHKNVSIHNLRHSYATHLLEEDIDLRSLQALMGHDSPSTTAAYTRLTNRILKDNTAIINQLMDRLPLPSMEDSNDED